MMVRFLLMSGSAIALVGLPVQAMAQSETPDTEQATAPSPDVSTTDQQIVVVGVRGAAETAAQNKENAKQIVDSVVAEDVGKLPDNNVVDAISRIPGVQIDRFHGQGQGVAIRGLGGVQTTINGNSANLGEGRAVNLADIPAELLKSVDVYKTRSADQVEGGIAGTVNVELRRPLDLPRGWTIAGSVKGVYDDISEKVGPYGSLLVANRMDAGDGEFGILINASWTKNFYREDYIESESPDIVCCRGDDGVAFEGTPARGLPAGFEGAVIPYRSYYGLEQGNDRRPSINVAMQWRPSDNLDFVLEGSYIGSRGTNASEQLYLLTREGGGLVYNNIELQPDGKSARSLDISNPNGLIAGVVSTYNRSRSDLYTTNFETHFRTDKAQLNFSAQYTWSKTGYYFVQQVLRPPQGVSNAKINYFSDIYKKPVPSVEFTSVDLTDPTNYGLERFQDNKGGSDNNEFATQLDLTLLTSDTGFLRNWQFGARYNVRDVSNNYGYRDGFPRIDGKFAPLSAIPGGGDASLVGPGFPGAQQWLRIPGKTVYDNVGQVIDFIRANTEDWNKPVWGTEFPPSDRGQTFDSRESTFAAYAQLNYVTKLVFPIDGYVGVRYVNTWGTSKSFNFQPGNPQNEFRDIVTESSGRGNFVDILPSAAAVIHFADRTQLRLSYSTNVQRPSFYDIRPFYFAETRANPKIIFAGNPDLKAQREHSYNVSAEHYFGRGGQLSLNAYYKKATGFLFYSREEEVLTRFGFPGETGFVEQLRNAGDGTFIGVEAVAQTFFDFLPGFWSNFGVNLNGAYSIKARIEYPFPEEFPGAYDSPGNSDYTANAIMFYDTPKFSARVAFNYRSAFRLGVFTGNPPYSPYQDDTYRLDAAINYTPVKFLTLSLEGGNILGNDVYRYFGENQLIPLGVRTLGRTVQASARFRF